MFGLPATGACRKRAGTPARGGRLCSPDGGQKHERSSIQRFGRTLDGDRGPQAIFLAAAKVGGILANKLHPADFLYQNSHDRAERHSCGVQAWGREASLPRFVLHLPPRSPSADQGGGASHGTAEQTNEAYALAKIAGIKLCQSYREQHGCNFIAVMPTNFYGPNDNFHPQHSHMAAALMSRFHDAKVENVPEVKVWGTGRPCRELLFADDLADACTFLMKTYSGPVPLNIGTGEDLTIRSIAEVMRSVVGYEGELTYDPSYPDGTPRKVLDVSRLSALGWKAKTPLQEGLTKTYRWYCDNLRQLRAA